MTLKNFVSMPKNSLAGKHPSYLKLKWSPSSIARKKAYDKKYAATDKQKKYRAELNQANRKAGTYGKMTAMGKDRSHKKDGSMVLENRHENRGRNGQNGNSTKK
jgi:hypothetical protein